jgi:hypothetical protein
MNNDESSERCRRFGWTEDGHAMFDVIQSSVTQSAEDATRYPEICNSHAGIGRRMDVNS